MNAEFTRSFRIESQLSSRVHVVEVASGLFNHLNTIQRFSQSHNMRWVHQSTQHGAEHTLQTEWHNGKVANDCFAKWLFLFGSLPKSVPLDLLEGETSEEQIKCIFFNCFRFIWQTAESNTIYELAMGQLERMGFDHCGM